ncbi:calcium-binding protein [Oscillatoria sp. CS-180]|uniref:calcium-binding protein n=1 Tax=Oscillatoria sp. CS-180 TaxID=3021720 RepID=UPI00232B011B|nr:calcium-binding protein [Oscillatoria sp. CS-180]MDB9529817.1 calcium-binding protein [Oscillatoria sp. CS-180]
MTDNVISRNEVQQDGVELLNPGESLRVDGVLQVEQEPAVLTQSVDNSILVRGTVQSDTTAIQVEGIDTVIENRGLISGDFNGINVANGDFASALITNQRRGVITSESRAVNIGGIGAVLKNRGLITTTADPRNGTVYGDVTADNISIFNEGTIDVGEGNNGDAISLELGHQVFGQIVNSGRIHGRGEALGSNQAAAIRLYWVPAAGETSTFNGDIINDGILTAENGPVVVVEENTILNGDLINNRLIENTNPDNGVGIRVEDGGEVTGVILNNSTIIGDRTAIDIANGGTANATIINEGRILSDSRPVNLGGDTNILVNNSRILSTADPRNGTVYGDVTARNIVIENNGFIDVGEGNNGDAISLELGAVVNGAVVNTGTIRGRGESQSDNTEAAAIRLYWVESAGSPVSVFNGDIINDGTLLSETGGAVIIDDRVVLNGTIVNNGLIRGGDEETSARVAVDAEEAASPIVLVNNNRIIGDVKLSQNDDVYIGLAGQTQGVVFGNDGNDQLLGGDRRDILSGGSGNDFILGNGLVDILSGGSGNDFIDGGSGNDDISGGSGVNFVITGAGQDRVLLSDEGFVAIADFTAGEDSLALGDLNASDLKIESLFNSTIITAKTTGKAIAFVPFISPDQLGRFREVNADILLEEETPNLPTLGNPEASVFSDGSENEILIGTPDSDLLDGLGGNDVISGLAGADSLDGNTGNDVINGGSDNDILLGSNDNDVVSGDAGDDLIDGGSGNDVLLGGIGADTFTVTPTSGVDIIVDFEVGVDTLRLEGGLTLGQISLVQSDSNTLVLTETGTPLVGLANVQADDLVDSVVVG